MLSLFSGAAYSFSTPVHGDSPHVFWMPLSPKRREAPRSGFGRNPDGEVGGFSSTFSVPDTVRLPTAPRAASSYPTTEPQYLTSSTATPVTTSNALRQAQARSNFYLAVTRPPGVQDSCNGEVWGDRRKTDIRSPVGSIFQIAARGLRHLAARFGGSLDQRSSRPSCSAIICSFTSGVLTRSLRLSLYVPKSFYFVHTLVYNLKANHSSFSV